MKLLSLFSGIGAFEKALDRLNIDYQLVNYCEIDKYASKSYSAIHSVPESLNLGDITKVDEKALPKDIDLITYGFPCQDISLAGKQKGLFNEDGTQTRSGLFFEALRIIEETQPRVAIAENVKNLTSKKFSKQFKIVLDSLEDAGYNNYFQVLNAKDYGIPQNRERVFIVSIRKDIDTGSFKFPEGFPLKLRLKDLLEDEVDEKYYLSDKALQGIKNSTYERKQHIVQTKDWCDTLLSRDYKDPKCVQVGQIYGTEKEPNPQAGRIYDADGISPTMDTCSGGNRMPKVLVREATKQGYAEAFEGDSINLEQPNSKTRRGRVGRQVAQTLTTSCNQAVAVAMRGRYSKDGTVEQHIEISDREYANALTTVQKDSLIGEPNVLTQKRTEYGKAIRKDYEAGEVNESWHNMKEYVPREDGISNTLTTVPKDNYVVEPRIEVLGNYSPSNHDASRIVSADGLAPTVKENHGTVTATNVGLRIRKLTPKECFRLMDFDDEDFDKAEAVNSNTQLYKQAGNSIVVACPYYITKALIEANILIESENNQMEMKISDYQLPEKISFNFEELKQELTAKVSMYETMVYTDENIKDAKADRANLNKLKKALNDERIRREKEYMIPFNEFKAQVQEIINIIDKPCMIIDKQVKEFEEKQKQDKLDAITEFFNSTTHPEWLHISQIMDEKWLNASVSMKSVQEAIDARLEQIEIDLTTLSDLPEFGFEATKVYESSLDINKALNEGHRMAQIAKAKAEREAEQARLKAEAEAKAAEEAMKKEEFIPPVVDEEFEAKAFKPNEEPQKQWIRFQAYMSVDDAMALKQFFNDRQIEFKAV